MLTSSTVLTNFLLLTMIFWFAGMCILDLFFKMIQPDGLLDVTFGWQKMLEHLYSASKPLQLLGKALGDCRMCTAFWFMPIWFTLYVLSTSMLLHWWISDMVHAIVLKIMLNIIWYIVFHSIGAVVGRISLFTYKIKTKTAG